MSRAVRYEFSVLNITLQPHSPELYVRLFDKVFSQKPAISKKYYGSDHISLKLIEKIMADNKVKAIYGAIQKYTIIDSDSWYDQEINSRASQGDEPNYDLKRYSPNYKSFDFIFLPEGHRMFIVTRLKNDSLSIQRLAVAIHRIFNIKQISDEYNEVSVNVESESSTIERILAMEQLERLQIDVSLDNDDDNYLLKDNILEKMRTQKVRKEKRMLIGEKNRSIVPDPETKAFMELSLSNGYTVAHGKKDGIKVVEKTNDYPIHKIGKINLSFDKVKDKLFSYAQRTIAFLKKRQSKSE